MPFCLFSLSSVLFCLLIIAQEGAHATTKISAILKQDAFLPCETRRSINIHLNSHRQASQSIKSDHINLILWYREGSSMPFYRIDGRELNDHLNPTEPDNLGTVFSRKGKHYKNDSRIEFDLREVTPLLRIRNVTEEDEGTYQCRVEYASQRTFFTQIRLSVIGLYLFDNFVI